MKKYILGLFLTISTLAVSSVVYAQDAGLMDAGGAIEVPGEVIVVTPPDVDADPMGFFELLYQKVMTGEWVAVFGAGLIILTWVGRKLGSNLWPWLATKAGGYVANFSMALAASVGTSLLAGEGFSFGLAAAALGIAFAASGGWEALSDFLSWLSRDKEEEPSPAE